MRPSLDAQRRFLFEGYFGTEGAAFECFVDRAYRDMNRTLRGLGKLDVDTRKRVQEGAKACILGCFEGLRRVTPPEKPPLLRDEFNAWHRDSCTALTRCYARLLHGVTELRMSHGQAQKWINMVMKYCWAFGNVELDWLVPWFPAAHVPVDEVVLRATVTEKIASERAVVVWSKWDDPDAYQAFQEQWRVAAWAQGRTPMELEFELWSKHRREFGASAEQS